MSNTMAIVAVLTPAVAVVVSIALVGFATGAGNTSGRLTVWCNGIARMVDIQALVIGALAVDVLGLLAIAYLQGVKLEDARVDVSRLQDAVVWQQERLVELMEIEIERQEKETGECRMR